MERLTYEQATGVPFKHIPPPTVWHAHRCELHAHIWYAKAQDLRPRCPIDGSASTTAAK